MRKAKFPIGFISPSRLAPVLGVNADDSRLNLYVSPLVQYLPVGGISLNRERLCHFLAQVFHESGGLRYSEEIASGDDYEGRADLGNSRAGDGRLYKGRGLIQLTGRANYRLYGGMLGIDLENYPNRAKEPDIAVRIAVLYWVVNDLSPLADAGDLQAITRRINGGLNGLTDRWLWLNKTMTAYDRWYRE